MDPLRSSDAIRKHRARDANSVCLLANRPHWIENDKCLSPFFCQQSAKLLSHNNLDCIKISVYLFSIWLDFNGPDIFQPSSYYFGREGGGLLIQQARREQFSWFDWWRFKKLSVNLYFFLFEKVNSNWLTMTTSDWNFFIHLDEHQQRTTGCRDVRRNCITRHLLVITYTYCQYTRRQQRSTKVENKRRPTWIFQSI